MIKDQLLNLLKVFESETKTRCEQAYFEQDRDTWSLWNDQIRDMIKKIKKGYVK
tara:strand:+ start:129 stop:290 length:162 start_codon:yes stop_codon:yes gene_type:complete